MRKMSGICYMAKLFYRSIIERVIISTGVGDNLQNRNSFYTIHRTYPTNFFYFLFSKSYKWSDLNMHVGKGFIKFL